MYFLIIFLMKHFNIIIFINFFSSSNDTLSHYFSNDKLFHYFSNDTLSHHFSIGSHFSKFIKSQILGIPFTKESLIQRLLVLVLVQCLSHLLHQSFRKGNSFIIFIQQISYYIGKVYEFKILKKILTKYSKNQSQISKIYKKDFEHNRKYNSNKNIIN